MASTKLPSINNKEYDIYSKLKSWGTKPSDNDKHDQIKKSDELLKKYMTGRPIEKRYDIEYRPKRDPYTMNSQKNHLVNKRTVAEGSDDSSTNNRQDIFLQSTSKRQKTETAASRNYSTSYEKSQQKTTAKQFSKSEQLMYKTSRGSIDQKQYNIEYRPTRDPYAMNRSISHSRTKIVKQSHIDESVDIERQEKTSDMRIKTDQTSYTNTDYSQKNSPINSPRKINKTNKAGGTPKRSTSLTSNKHKSTPQHQETNLPMTDNTESPRFRDDDFYDEWFLPDQYVDDPSKEDEIIHTNINKVNKIDARIPKDIKVDTEDRTSEEENYFQSIKRDLASARESFKEEKQEGFRDLETKVDRVDEERTEIKEDVIKTEETDTEDVLQDLDLRQELIKDEVRRGTGQKYITEGKDEFAEVNSTTEQKYTTEVNDKVEKVKNDHQEVAKTSHTMNNKVLDNRTQTKKKIKERNYFQPLPPVPIKSKRPTQKPKKSQPEKKEPVKTVKTPRQYLRKKQPEKEPPTTVKYPSREELRLNSRENDDEAANKSPGPASPRLPSSPTPDIPKLPSSSPPPDIPTGDIDITTPITKEEEDNMNKLLNASKKCYVKTSRAHVRAA